MSSTLDSLARVLEERKHASRESSYVAGLYAAGIDKILKKVGEEATELVLAGKGDDDGAIVKETADLWFHTLVLLTHRGIHPRAVLEELESRMGLSGLEEKAARQVISD